MSWLLLLMLAIIAALFDHGPLALLPVAPQAIIALAAWAGVNGRDRDMLPRVWLIGIVADAIDPGSQIFYGLALLLCSLVLLPLRRFLFRNSLVAWSIWAAILTLAVHFCDLLSGGYAAYAGWEGVVASASLTAVLVMPIGFLLNVLKPPLHPLGDVSR